MAEAKLVKVVAFRPFLHKSKRVEIGSVVECTEAESSDILGTLRGKEATKENVEEAKGIADAAAKAAKDAAAKTAPAR